MGGSGALECRVSSPGSDAGVISINADISWFGPDGSLIATSPPNSTLFMLDIAPFEEEDYGSYRCEATVTSPDFPLTTAFATRTQTILRECSNTGLYLKLLFLCVAPAGQPSSARIIESGSPPTAGQPYNLTCAINSPGQSIEWIGPDGNRLVNGSEIMVGNVVSGSGVTQRTVTFPTLSTVNTGFYTCENKVLNTTRLVIVDC